MIVSIFGDSWSTNSYEKDENFTERDGVVTFEKLFANDNHQCYNFSVQGSSNKQLLDAIQTNIDKVKASDIVFVFQTDPLRDLLQSNTQEITVVNDVATVLQKTDHIDSLAETLLENFYKKISNIASEYMVNFCLIGGLSKLYMSGIPSNIGIVPNSWTETLVEGYKDIYYEFVEPTLCVWNYFNKLHNWNQGYDEFFEIEKTILEKNHHWHNSPLFSWCHPSDSGYLPMYNIMKEKLYHA